MEEGLVEAEVEEDQIPLLVVQLRFEGLARKVAYYVLLQRCLFLYYLLVFVISVRLLELGVLWFQLQEFIENGQAELVVLSGFLNLQLIIQHFLDVLHNILVVFVFFPPEVSLEALVAGRRGGILLVVLLSIEQVASDHRKAPGFADLLVLLLHFAHRQVRSFKFHWRKVVACFRVFEQTIQPICDVIKNFPSGSILDILIEVFKRGGERVECLRSSSECDHLLIGHGSFKQS